MRGILDTVQTLAIHHPDGITYYAQWRGEGWTATATVLRNENICLKLLEGDRRHPTAEEAVQEMKELTEVLVRNLMGTHDYLRSLMANRVNKMKDD